MATVDFDIKFPREDVEALFAQMQRAQKEIGASMGGAIKMAGFQLARTMGTSTAVSDKKRDYKIIQQRRARPGRPKQMMIEVTSYRGGKKKTFRRLIDGGKREANKSTAVEIGMRGLAKSSWKWGAKGAKTAGAVGYGRDVSRSAKQWGSRYGRGKGHYRGDSPYYVIESRLPYIRKALQGGERTVETATQRAARALSETIDNKLKKKMGAK